MTIEPSAANPNDVANPWRDVGDAGTVGLQIIFSLAIFYWIGHWLDVRWGGGRGWFTAIGVFYGIAASIKALWDANKRMKKRLEELDAEEARERERRRKGES